MSSPPILRLDRVAKRFGSFEALKGIDLQIREGEFFTIVGPSGSGKSTLIRILVGMDDVTEGQIYLREQRIDPVPANQRPTCMVFQSLALFPHMSVGQNIEFPLTIQGIDKAHRRERALSLLSLLQLPEEHYDKRIQQCSGGERQRVALARALAFEPEILFFDEPLSALDYRLRKVLEKELKELHSRTGKTFVYITHSLEEAMVMSDRIAILNHGVFEQIADVDEIYNRPANRFVAEFMGEVNLFEAEGTTTGELHIDGVQVNPKSTQANHGILLQPGETGVLMVRPERIRVLAEPEDADFSIHCILQHEYVLGSRLQYEFQSAAYPKVTVEKLRESQLNVRPGHEAILGFDANHIHLIRSQ